MNAVLSALRAQLLGGRRLYFALGFASFAGAFSLRVVRDTALISAAFAASGFEASRLGLHTGADILPASFLANAVLMTFFATRLGGWLQRFPAELITLTAFFAVAAAAAISALVLPAITNPWAFLAFYILAEVPIFLFMNMIWILAGPRFTELEQRKFFPKVTGYAYLGALTPALIMLGLVSFDIARVDVLLVLAALAALTIAACAAELRQRSGTEETEPQDIAEDASASPPGQPGLIEEIRWAFSRRYMGYFVLVTIANFVLLGIFDQTMASAAANIGMDAKTLFFRLLLATCFFAAASTLVQFLAFESMLDRFGAAKLNLFAPFFMLSGCLIYVLFGTTWLTGNTVSADKLFWAALAARVCGWFAEFLFNQALLPYIYGALPVRDENRGRLLVEGPVTAMTNGAVGVLLTLYIFLFAIGSDKVRFELLFVTALVLAVLMLVGSVLMVPQYRLVLLERLRVGDPLDRLDVASRRLLAPVLATRRFQEAGRLPGSDAVLARALAESDQAGFLAALPSAQEVPAVERIVAIVRAADRLGLLAQIENRLGTWLKSADGPAFLAAAQGLCALGFDGAAAVRDEVERRRRGEEDKLELSRAERLALAVMLRSELLLAEALEGLWSDSAAIDEIDVVSLAEQPIARPPLVLDVFLLVLARLTAEGGPIPAAAQRMVERHPWLRFVVCGLLERSRADTPLVLRGCRHVAPSLLALPIPPSSDARDFELFKAAAGGWRDGHAFGSELAQIQEMLATIAGSPGHRKPLDEDLSQFVLRYAETGDELGTLASLLKVMADRRRLGITTSPIDLDPILAAWRRAAARQSGSRIPRAWRRTRAIQLITARLHLQTLAGGQAAPSDNPPALLAARLVDGGGARDRTLTALEQTIPRAIYRTLQTDLDLALSAFDAPNSGEAHDAILPASAPASEPLSS